MSEQKPSGEAKFYTVTIIFIVLFALLVKGCSGGDSTPTYKNINDANEQELSDFLKWDAKQKK